MCNRHNASCYLLPSSCSAPKSYLPNTFGDIVLIHCVYMVSLIHEVVYIIFYSSNFFYKKNTLNYKWCVRVVRKYYAVCRSLLDMVVYIYSTNKYEHSYLKIFYLRSAEGIFPDDFSVSVFVFIFDIACIVPVFCIWLMLKPVIIRQGHSEALALPF